MTPALLILCACIAQLAVSSSAASEYDVVVIGAGAAGLSAAKKLASKGLNVVIIEARNRVGGRCYSSNVTANGKSVPVDLGASWIHGIKGNPLSRIAKSAKVALSSKTTNYENGVLYDQFGKEVPDYVDRKYSNNWRNFLRYLRAAQNSESTSAE